MQDILKNTILPIAFQYGNRWLGSWAFWLLHRRDLAVRIILVRESPYFFVSILIQSIHRHLYKISPPPSACKFRRLESLITTTRVWHCCSHNYDRKRFKLRKEPAKFQVELSSTLSCRCLVCSVGWVSVPLRFKYKIYSISVGCHVLALDLVRSWSFARPSTAVHGLRRSPTAEKGSIASPSPSRPLFPLEPALRRRSSIMIDMDILSPPPTRKASPVKGTEDQHLIETIQEESDFFARKAGLGNLMKSAKQDVKVPEFDIDAFF